MRARLISYNIQFGRGQDGKYDLARIAAALEDADIACLQEVTTHWAACNGDHQPDRLSEALGLHAVFASGFELGVCSNPTAGRPDNRRRAFGNMVLSRWPIVYSRPHSLGRPPTIVPADFPDPRTDLPRCALEAVIDAPAGPLRVVSVHLSHLPGAQRSSQVQTLRTLVTSLPKEAPLWSASDPVVEPWTEGGDPPPMTGETVFAGDFNFKPDDPEYAAILQPNAGTQLVDGWLQVASEHLPTCVEADGSGSTLDYGFFTQGVSDFVVDAQVVHDVTASDHFPVCFDLELP